MARTPLEMVREFHEAFDCEIAPSLGLEHVDDDLRYARVEFMREELEEYVRAAYGTDATVEVGVITVPFGVEAKPDIVEIADALADLVYFAYGAALCYGIDLDAVFEEVHRSNMAKLQPDGTVLRGENNKVQKPATWTPPNVAAVLGLEDV